MVARLSFALVAISVLVTRMVQCAPVPGEKLLFSSTDGKHDDKMAMTFGERKGDYDEHHVLINGVHNTDATHHNIDDWNQWMDYASEGQPIPRKFFRGSTPFIDEDGQPMASSHEEIFENQQGGNVYAARQTLLRELHGLPGHLYEHRGKHADFVSMAPIPYAELLHVLGAMRNAGIILDSFHHIAGYNSRQDYASRRRVTAETDTFLQSLQDQIHQYFPQCHVYMTNTKHNFEADHAGGTQDFDDMVGRFPAHHMDQVGILDTFAMSQIEATKSALGNNFYPFVGNDGESEITPAEVWEARRNEDPHSERTQRLRRNILRAIEVNLQRIEQGHNLHNRLPSLAQGIRNTCQGEACDFNHVALLHESLNTGEPELEHVHIGNGIKFRSGNPRRENVHGLSPQRKSYNKAVTTHILKNTFPVIDHNAFHENVHG